MAEPAFARSEYRDRIQRVRAAMAARGLEVLVVSDPSNMAWLTGYDGWSFYVHQAVVIGLEGDPVWWGRAMDANGARRTAFMGEDQIVGYDDAYVQNPDKHPMEVLAGLIQERFRGRVGVELDNYYYSAAAHRTLSVGLSAEPEDATGLVNWCRAVKSPAEIEYMRRAAGIVEAMHARILEVAEPGMPKNAAGRRDLSCCDHRGERALGRLPSDRSDGALWCRCHGPASDVG